MMKHCIVLALTVVGLQTQVLMLSISGGEDYDRLRPLSYHGVNVVLICYNVMCPSSFDNVFVKVFFYVFFFSI